MTSICEKNVNNCLYRSYHFVNVLKSLRIYEFQKRNPSGNLSRLPGIKNDFPATVG